MTSQKTFENMMAAFYLPEDRSGQQLLKPFDPGLKKLAL